MAGARAAAPAIARGAAALGSKAKTAWDAMRGAGAATKYVPQSDVAKAAVKSALGTGAATMAAQYAIDKLGGSSEPAVAPAKDQTDAETARLARQNAAAAPKPQQSAQPAKPSASPAAAPALSTEEEGEMGVLAQELLKYKGKVPEVDALLQQYEKMRPGAAAAQP